MITKLMLSIVFTAAAVQAHADDQKLARKTEGLFSKKDMVSFLDEYRHDDQDAYGSETFTYTFKYANCWKNNATVDCKLYYNMKINWTDKIAQINGVWQVVSSTPEYPYVEVKEPLKFAVNNKEPSKFPASGVLKSRLNKKDDKKHSYDSVCIVSFPSADFGRSTVFGGKHDDVKPEFKELFDDCLSAGDKALVEKLQSAVRK